MSRKHKMGWEEMAANVVVISLKKARKALNITCDFQERNLLPQILCPTLPAETPGQVLQQEMKVIDELVSPSPSCCRQTFGKGAGSGAKQLLAGMGRGGGDSGPLPFFGEGYHGVTLRRREISISWFRFTNLTATPKTSR